MNLRPLRGWLVRLFSVFHRKQREQEFAEELASHLAFHMEDNLRAGMSPEEARRQALIKLGGVALTQERYREQRGLPMLETFIQDLRFGVRMLRKNPGFSLITVLTLALGIGVNTAIFSVVNAVLLRPLQFKDPERLVWVWGTVPKFSQANHSPVEFLAFQSQQNSFTDLAAYRNMSFTVTGDAQPEQVQGLIASANYFSLLGVAAIQGRAFLPEDGEPGAARVAVVSHDLWQTRCGKLRLSCFQKACLLIPNSLAAAAWFQSQTRRASNSCDLVSSSCLSSRSSQVSFTTHFPAKSARLSTASHGIVASIASATAFSSIVRRSNAILNSMPATSGDSDAPTAFETIFWSSRTLPG